MLRQCDTGIAAGDSKCGDDVTGLLVKERCSLDILSVKKEASMPAKYCSTRLASAHRRLHIADELCFVQLHFIRPIF